jgi:branched-chain amino acid transport system ATP-binding protein
VSGSLLVARGLRKSYGAVPVIRDLDFDVTAGEVLAVLGPNGAGKTTLFNLISGDVACDAGELSFDGLLLKTQKPFERCRLGIGRTYQVPKPYAGMTVLENLLVAAMFGARLDERGAAPVCGGILEEFGLAAKADVPAGRLTLLDRKRLELARALASRPRLLLLDEIAGGLTDEEAEQLVRLIAGLKARQVTIVWIEHVLRAVMAVADRALVLNFGERIALGPAAGVMSDPEVRRVYMGIEA